MEAVMTAAKMNEEEEIQMLGLEILAETPALAYAHLSERI